MFGLIAGGIGSLMNGITGAVTSSKNYKLQKEQLEYQKKLQQQIFDREDNAVQRRAADMAKAGLSKTLAAGGSASTGPVVQTQAPQIDTPSLDLTSFTAGEANYLRQQEMQQRKNLVDAQVDSEKAKQESLEADSARTAAETAQILHDLEINRKYNQRKGEKTDLWSVGRGAADEYGYGLKEIKEQVDKLLEKAMSGFKKVL